METCKLCPEEAVVIVILDDNARLLYCAEHIPTHVFDREGQDQEDRLLDTLRRLVSGKSSALTDI